MNRANVLATELIAKECEKLGAGMLYTSTDLVYAGYRGSYLKEDAKLVPLSLYAETKLMGEVKIKEVLGKFIIVRTPLQFGAGYNGTTNNFQEMVRRFVKGEKVKLFSDRSGPQGVLRVSCNHDGTMGRTGGSGIHRWEYYRRYT